MKKLMTLFAMLTLFVSMMAQTTPFNYQAVLRDPTTKELVRNQTVLVTVSALIEDMGADPVDLTAEEGPIEAKTNTDGIVEVTVPAYGEFLNWENAVIIASFNIGGKADSIVIETPVTPVPVALEASNGVLTTPMFVNYIKSATGHDVDTIYKALMENDSVYHVLRDSIVQYIKDHYTLAREIAFYYLDKVSANDVGDVYEAGHNLDQEVKDSIFVVAREFLKDNRDMLVRLAEYYAGHFTQDQAEELFNSLSPQSKAEIERILDEYFDQYLEKRKMKCPNADLCH